MHARWLRAAAYAILLLSISDKVCAGGIRINIETLNTRTTEVAPNGDLSIDFDATDYEAGEAGAKYILFAVAPTRPVRHRGDTMAVRDHVVHMRTVYEPSSPIIYYRLLASMRAAPVMAGSDSSDGPSHFDLHFKAPALPGTYELLYSELPVFRPLSAAKGDQAGQMIVTDPARSDLGLRQALTPGVAYESAIMQFKVTTAPIAHPLILYVRANDKEPAFANIKGGLVDKPLTFSWFIGPEAKLPANKFVYRYKIWPVDSDFSAWTHDRSVSYRFLPKGNVKFTVEAEYRDGPAVMDSIPGTVNFILDQHLVANATSGTALKGPTTKSYSDNGQLIAPTVAFEDLYPRSRALIVGVHTFDDHGFVELGADKIQKDVDTLEMALEANGFTVTKVIADRLDRDEIMAAVENLVTETRPDDRLFIYFSTHGFPDPALQTAGWLATSDCKMADPSVHCIALKDLEYQSQRALNLKAKQVLIAVDSCFSGLGIISKSVNPPNFNMLAARQGAFMLTAGMADQNAEIDPTLGMSTFTYYLSKGLSGMASIFDANGVMTLTQLYAYVQYNVTARSGSRQTPMLGRLTGDGEMLFRPILKH